MREPAGSALTVTLRRLFAEGLGTYLLVLVAAGAGVVDAVSGGEVGRVATVAAPGLLVLAVILSAGAVSGAHLNPVVTLAFAARGDFRWTRVPSYVAAQLVGAVLAAVTLRVLFGDVAHAGATVVGPGFTAVQALSVEVLATLTLVSTILGSSSGAQNVGPLSAMAVGAAIALGGLWAGPVSGASMNPARSIGPQLVDGDVHLLWIYLVGPVLGAGLAVAGARVLRGPGGGPVGTRSAQGDLHSPAAVRSDAAA
ncbi:MIP/aquaporin family protein [Jannaschia sp. R86511]|uniref:MIP/aquaporin family protein n=1 Tax=Jannaschia sp. R86511 TaxID=3093853 RepID=UPI0036D4028C